MKKYIYLTTIITIICTYAVPLLDDDIGQQIFYQNKNYLLYVHQIPNESFLLQYTQFCSNGHLCAIMNSENEVFERLTTFVGYHANSYLLIFDIENRLKYCLNVEDNHVTAQQIAIFVQQFKNGKLDPYFTSEPIPQVQTQKYFTKVVGLTFQSFLNQASKVRVLYLYTQDQLCSNCLDVYKALQKNAKQYLGSNVQFGYLDLFKNQHKLLVEQTVPLILVYQKDSHNYTKFDSENIDKLAQTLSSLLKQQEAEGQL